ncbi:HNH endonuclease [Sphingomonas aerophila]|uniref:Putative HNH nuclease YajD n=1 Tax=Sphingomonas aerophila TaxID=1344948 RepID=A0A7W9BD16_9SPHN|nr:HNH endonuclease [Sphingomonas aerophila]MBB5714763.1 5-methylcytosine-specific restriction endonuclease McrA [Sphingomonas aerophila]
MGKLKTLPHRLASLKPSLGSLPPVERSDDATRRLNAPWRKWYGTARWQKLRLATWRRDLFTCQWPGCGRVTADTLQLVADHKIPHRGDERLFWDESNVQTLCKPCHDSRKQRAENAARRS